MQQSTGTLWTIGHSTRDWEAFVSLLRAERIQCLVDVRRFPGSRRHPQFAATAMADALPAAGIAYEPMPDLGGRRTPVAGSPNDAWRVAAFRGYADYMASDAFAAARAKLMQLALDRRCAILCAEAVWWRCHRRLIADDFVARGWEVRHLLGPGKQQSHPLHPEAVLVDGVLRYPAAGDAQPGLF